MMRNRRKAFRRGWGYASNTMMVLLSKRIGLLNSFEMLHFQARYTYQLADHDSAITLGSIHSQISKHLTKTIKDHHRFKVNTALDIMPTDAETTINLRFTIDTGTTVDRPQNCGSTEETEPKANCYNRGSKFPRHILYGNGYVGKSTSYFLGRGLWSYWTDSANAFHREIGSDSTSTPS